MQKVKVFYENFWPGFNPTVNRFTQLLLRRFCVSAAASAESADVVFESYPKPTPGGQIARRVPPAGQVRIFFSGERFNLPVGRHHAVISGNLLASPNHFRYPLWMLSLRLLDGAETLEEHRFGGIITYDMVQRPIAPDSREGFACAVFSNPSHFRWEIVRQLRTRGAVWRTLCNRAM